MDLFATNRLTELQVETASDLIWSNSKLDATTKFFKVFETDPADDAELADARKGLKFKVNTFRLILWNSLSAKYKIELLSDKTKLKNGREMCALKLWSYIKRTVNPGTAVGAKALKDKLESKKMSEFGHDVSKYNQWLKETRAAIIQDEGAGLYNEYTKCVFKTYMTCNNAEFFEMVKSEKRRL